MLRSTFLTLAFFLHIYCVTAQQFSMEAVTSYPFPSELTSAAHGSNIAWAMNEQGKRNVYVAAGPEFTPRKLTSYTIDDGQEISSLSISGDGKWVVYSRGGDHGGKDASNPVNPTHLPIPPKTEVWSIPFAGGTAKVLSEGDYPVISPRGDSVAFIKSGQIWIAPVDGAVPARNLVTAKGSCYSIVWAPDGSGLAFVNNRGDHSYIGIYRNATTPLQWIAPAFSKDYSPRWSPDGKQIAFIRTPGTGGAPDSLLTRKHQPWAIWTADVASGEGKLLWKAPATLPGSIPTTDGGTNLRWPVAGRIVFLSYHDGWPHIYSIAASGGGAPLLLTPGAFMTEHIKVSPDAKWIVFSANTGTAATDIDRRHLVRVPVDKAAMEILTSGDGIEAYPVVTGDGQSIAALTSTAQQPLLPAVMPFRKGTPNVIGKSLLPASFPGQQLVVPKPVTFKAPDGTLVYGQLFEPKDKAGKHPAVVYIHGGPQRQMLLGWSYMDYYSNSYAVNQYLANRGFVVLSVNYRLGIGYGYEFHKPPHAGIIGASEYQDIKAAGQWLAAQPQVDARKVGVYGGSYGGFLTAHALGRDSKLFAAGVDIHGVHTSSQFLPSVPPASAPDFDTAKKVAWLSSPVAYVDTWTSPVLLIHADDDRNVDFGQTVDLFRRLESKGVPFEYLAIPDDTHHWMKYSNALTVDKATAAFLIKHLKE